MPCDSRQLTQAQLEAGFQNQRTGVQKAIRPFSGEATPESLADYLNKEVFPVLQQARAKLNEVFLQVVDNAPSGNPLAFYFSDETGAADPTAGRIRLDAATQNTATTMRVSQENGRLVDVAPWLDVMAGGATSPLGTITLFDAINPGRFIRWDLDTMTDQGAYWDLGITVIESSHANPFVDGEGVVISFIPGVSAAGSTVPVGSLSPVAAETFIGNFTAAPAAPTARAGSDIAGAGLTYTAGGTLAVGAGTGIATAADAISVDATLAEILANGNTTDANDIHISTGQQVIFDVGGDALGDIQSLGTLQVRAASTVDMRAATGNFGLTAVAGQFNMSGTTQLNFTASAATGFIRFITNGTSRLIIAGDGSWQLAGDDGTTGELLQSQGATSPPIWGTAVTASYTDGSVTLPKIATQAAGTVLANVTAGPASPTAHALSTLAGSGLTYTNVTGVMDVDDVALTALADQADDTFLANISGGAAPPTAVALTTLAGAGLTGGANAVLAVGAGDGIDVNADDVAVDVTDIIDNVTITEVATNNIQRAALTGFAAASAGSNATTSAEPIVTYSASANMSAERVLTSGTNTTVDTSVANQIRINVASSTDLLPTSGAHQGDTLAFNGAAWQVLTEILRDEFVGADYLSADAMISEWVWVLSDSAECTVEPTEGAPGHPGVVRFITTATAPGPCWMSPSLDVIVADRNAGQIDFADVAWLRAVCRIADVAGTTDELSSATYGIGLVSTADSTELDTTTPNMGGTGLAFIKNLSQTDWRCRRETAAATANLSTGLIAVVGDWVELFAVNLGGGSWEVFANGVSSGNITGVATSGMVFPCVWIDDDDVTAADRKAIDVDLFEIGVLISGNRFT